MREILDFLVGKKSYVMIGVDAMDAIGVLQGWWDEGKMRHIIELALTAAAFRAGINSSAPQPIPFISAGKLSIAASSTPPAVEVKP